MRLDLGEQHAIALAYEHGALLVVDDSLGRAAARRLNLAVTGVVGVVIRAKKEGSSLVCARCWKRCASTTTGCQMSCWTSRPGWLEKHRWNRPAVVAENPIPFELCRLLNSSTPLPASELPTSLIQAIMLVDPNRMESTTACPNSSFVPGDSLSAS